MATPVFRFLTKFLNTRWRLTMQETRNAAEATAAAITGDKKTETTKSKLTVAEEVSKEAGFQAWAAHNDTDVKNYGAQYLFGYGSGKKVGDNDKATERFNLVKLAAIAQARIAYLDTPTKIAKSGC